MFLVSKDRSFSVNEDDIVTIKCSEQLIERPGFAGEDATVVQEVKHHTRFVLRGRETDETYRGPLSDFELYGDALGRVVSPAYGKLNQPFIPES